jgi:hypothetical protein
METGVATWTECYKKWRVFPANGRSRAKLSQKLSDQQLTIRNVKSGVKQDEER